MSEQESEAERIPAEVFPLACFLGEEIEARGWTTTDVALRMGGVTNEQIGIDLFQVDLTMCVQMDGLTVGDSLFAKLSRAFDVSEEYLRNLDAAWRKWPERRVEYTPPDNIFGPASRRALMRDVLTPRVIPWPNKDRPKRSERDQ